MSAGDDCKAAVALDGSASYDPDGDPLGFNWTGSFGAVTGSNPTVSLGLGVHAIRLFVSDGLAADLGHVCAASGVGATLYLDRLPCSAAVRYQRAAST